MLNILFIILFVGLSVLWYLMEIGSICDDFEFYIGLTDVILGFALVISLIVLFGSHLGVSADIEFNKEEYNNLCYQLDKIKYDDGISLGEQKILKQVKDWNEDLAFKQKIQKDFWLGCYYPNIYDQFKFIEYKE